MNYSSHPPGFQPIRRDRLQQETVQDSYKSRGKLAEPAVCPECGAVFHGGRWQWLEKPQGAHSETCPACHRMRDRFPAGYVSIGGEFLASHEAEIMQLIKHHETREKSEHPLQRVMDIEKTDQGYQVTTTDIHLARGIGDALHHAYQGELEFHYNPDQNLLRVNWHR